MKYYAEAGGRAFVCRFEQVGGELRAELSDDGGTRTVRIDLVRIGEGRGFALLVDGRSHDVILERGNGPGGAGTVFVHVAGERIAVTVADERERAAHQVAQHRAGGRREVRAAMPGVVVDVLVAEGDPVEQGQTLCVLEAMKMQNPMHADAPARVTKLHCRKGDAVAAGALLVELDAP